MSSRILLVEDDERIRTSMRLSLEDEGYDVEETESGEEALEAHARALIAQPFDLLVVDIMLPGMDGFDCCRELRRVSTVPIIMVTARTDTHDVVAGLEAGADDYVTKPFEPKELAARIRALLRRARATDGGPVSLVFGDLEIMPEAGVVRRDDEEVHLTRTEFLLLCELAANTGGCSRESSCSSGCGATTTSATAASSTSTSAGCARRSSGTRASPAMCSPSRARLQAGSMTAGPGR